MPVTTRAVSPRGLAMIEGFEALRLRSYQDNRGVWTVGWGHTGHDVLPGMLITEAQAALLLQRDLIVAQAAVNAGAGDATWSQYDAMVSLAFNIGATGFATSSVLAAYRAGDLPRAAEAFLLWDKEHIDGKLVESPSLLRRRQLERACFLRPDTVVALHPLNGQGPRGSG